MARSKNLARIASGLAPLACVLATPAWGQTVEELQARLAAQEQVNQLLMQRIESLEAELEGDGIPARQISTREPEPEADDTEGMDALERTFVRRGVAVLPGGVVELAPSLVWSHADGGSDMTADDLFGVGMDARIGVAGGWMLGASVPVLHRRISNGAGHASGLGDVSATVWKSLMVQHSGRPSLVASVRYTAPTGSEAPASGIPLGSGLHQLSAGLSSVKTIAPIAFTGSVRYSTFLGDTFRDVDVDRGDIIGLAMGANLAVTPGISLSSGLDFAFERATHVNGARMDGSRATRGALEIGAGTVLARNTLLSFGAAIGILADSPDIAVSVSLPIRF